MTPLDLRRRIVRYLIEEDQPRKLDDLLNTIGYEYFAQLVYAMSADGLLTFLRSGIAIRNLSDAEQWLIDTTPRVEASE